jgi:hypothetical protein
LQTVRLHEWIQRRIPACAHVESVPFVSFIQLVTHISTPTSPVLSRMSNIRCDAAAPLTRAAGTDDTVCVETDFPAALGSITR